MIAYNVLVRGSLEEIIDKNPKIDLESEIVFSLRVLDIMRNLEKEFLHSDMLETPFNLLYGCLDLKDTDAICLKVICCNNMLDKFNNYMHSYL